MGDQVKSKIHVLGGKQEWGIAARCHTVLPCSTAVFRALVVPSADKVTPARFDKLLNFRKTIIVLNIGLCLVLLSDAIGSSPL